MVQPNRREFLSDVGRGMLLAGLGTTLAAELGIADLTAGETTKRLSFGKLEPLVALMQETAPAALLEQLVAQLQSGTSLQTLVAAGALANARSFGGQDYVGFHTFMALAPAYRMAHELPREAAPLPVLKVLYRNTNRIQECGGRGAEVLHAIEPEPTPPTTPDGEYLRQVARRGDVEQADRAFAQLAKLPPGEAFNHLQFEVQDEVDVHRVVLAWRAWDTWELAGPEWAHCLLRQSIRYCANTESRIVAGKHQPSPIRTVLPALLDQYKLLGRELGNRTGDDHWVAELAKTIYGSNREQAADAVAQALQAGYSPAAVGEAISLAANRLVLHDPGRPERWANSEKPVGSCHGDSVGVHASDAANAWRNIVRVSTPRNVVASLIVGAFHTAGQSDRCNDQPYPFAEHLDEVQSKDRDALLAETNDAIRNRDQFRAAACIARYGQLGYEPRPVFDLMLKYATSEDGALHAEKYYFTVCDEFATTRPAYRWGQLVALARVTASEFGYRSAGYEQAKSLLKIT